MTAAVPDPRFRDQLAEWLWQRTSQPDGDRWLSPRDTVAAGHDPNNLDHAVDDLLSLIAAEVEARVQAAANQRAAEFHRAENAEERGEGICRTCLAPIWNEGGTVRHSKRPEGWSDRIERGGDSLVCFKAVDYRHVPLTGREAAIYDRAAALASPAPALDAEEGQ